MKNQRNRYYILTVMGFIVAILVMISVLNYEKDLNYKIYISMFILISIIFFLDFISTKLYIEKDLSHNEIIVYKSILGVYSLHIKQINKIIFMKRKNFIAGNMVYLYGQMGELLIIDGNNNSYHELLKVTIDKTKDNKNIIIDRELLGFLKINNKINETQDNNQDNGLTILKEEIKKTKKIPLDSIGGKRVSFFSISLISTIALIFIINSVIPFVIGMYFVLTDLFL